MVVNEKTIVVRRENFVKSTMMLAYSIVKVKHTEACDMATIKQIEEGGIMLSLSVLPSEFNDVLGAFITISEVWLDNKKLNGFSKQTIELSAYQEGDIKLLFSGNINGGTFKKITLILDHDTDETGDFPGCYILNDDNQKEQINSCNRLNKIDFTKTINVNPDKTTEVVFQADLEKILAFHLQPINSGKWDSQNFIELSDSFKVVLKEECSMVKGEISRLNCSACEIYVLAYKKGEIGMLENCFDQEQYTTLIKNAVAGSKVKPYGGYQLSLLEAGEYEIHLVSFNREYNRMFRFKGMVNSSSNIPGLILKNVSVPAKSEIQLNIDIIGVI
ncbi:MAG: hypothetical protein JW833_06360 [Prolixibacteraceae bacterium]|nr:hypothetical protein [Prolixibacteraceae bacterium]